MEVGNKYKLPTGELRIMAFSEGYYMCRFKGCMPFVCDKKELESRIRTIKVF